MPVHLKREDVYEERNKVAKRCMGTDFYGCDCFFIFMYAGGAHRSAGADAITKHGDSTDI